MTWLIFLLWFVKERDRRILGRHRAVSVEKMSSCAIVVHSFVLLWIFHKNAQECIRKPRLRLHLQLSLTYHSQIAVGKSYSLVVGPFSTYYESLPRTTKSVLVCSPCREQPLAAKRVQQERFRCGVCDSIGCNMVQPTS
jgi:hypothetical protein